MQGTWDEKMILKKLNPPSLPSSFLGWDRCQKSLHKFATVTGEKPILSFETRSRIVFFQSRALRRKRDFVHRISSLETRSRILFTESRASRRDREFCSPNLEIRDEIEIFRSFYQNILVRKKDFSHKRSNITVQLEEEGS